MLHRSLTRVRVALAGACIALALTACAASAPARDPARWTPTAEQVPPGCVGSTGTRLPLKSDECAGFGHTYTRSEIDRTRVPDLGETLLLLDPSVTIHR